MLVKKCVRLRSSGPVSFSLRRRRRSMRVSVCQSHALWFLTSFLSTPPTTTTTTKTRCDSSSRRHVRLVIVCYVRGRQTSRTLVNDGKCSKTSTECTDDGHDEDNADTATSSLSLSSVRRRRRRRCHRQNNTNPRVRRVCDRFPSAAPKVYNIMPLQYVHAYTYGAVARAMMSAERCRHHSDCIVQFLVIVRPGSASR